MQRRGNVQHGEYRDKKRNDKAKVTLVHKSDNPEIATPGGINGAEAITSSDSPEGRVTSKFGWQDIRKDFVGIECAFGAWGIEWGPQSGWNKHFHRELDFARAKGQLVVDYLFLRWDEHIRVGRVILGRIKLFNLTHLARTAPTELMAVGLRIFEMIVSLMSEVRFFELKLEEYAAVVPPNKVSDIKYIGISVDLLLADRCTPDNNL
ncbi:hypothetical protein SERLA73DRAFT_75335 [Serpula lacrymans var. lacrymans S7.3]|uniref:Uncharacterized protein n=2 Tax=Serpula lacrymans var. lacrymans TaxID=341189 RepID=F8Q3B3_SERL3|nr:uncharacterized protein SERLADRAFT_440006 [Serpula lacrymans var. lacrymans S7.9]EGN97674.1 hypothetical protein SERLA73DRAFT_75335 [Serpula lacrymans var. lacrymans S7.3]EGO23266.1 hypothetical protein SERLADRAFT_440006 [Serpula lacrymans var. lacrymans S7.9]